MDKHDDKDLPEELQALALALRAAPLPTDRHARLKDRILAGATDQAPATTATVRAADRQWQFLLPGVESCLLHEDGSSCAFLLRMQRHSILPAHQHDVDEESIILEGDATVGDVGVAAGDYQFVPAGAAHPAIRTQNGCIVFIRGHRNPPLDIEARMLSDMARGMLNRWRGI